MRKRNNSKITSAIDKNRFVQSIIDCDFSTHHLKAVIFNFHMFYLNSKIILSCMCKGKHAEGSAIASRFSIHSGNANFAANKADNIVVVVAVVACNFFLLFAACLACGCCIRLATPGCRLTTQHNNNTCPTRPLAPTACCMLPAVGRLLVCCFYVHATFKSWSRGTLIV